MTSPTKPILPPRFKLCLNCWHVNEYRTICKRCGEPLTGKGKSIKPLGRFDSGFVTNGSERIHRE